MGNSWGFLALLALTVFVGAWVLLAVIHKLVNWPEPVKHFFCRNMGWHGPWQTKEFDGCSVHAVCDWCESKGLIDSQGNFFT